MEYLNQFNLTKYFELECNGILNDIKELCTSLEIPMFFAGAIENSETRTEYIVEDNLRDIPLLVLKDNHFAHHKKIMEGYVAKPPREEIVLPLDEFLSGTEIKEEKKNIKEKDFTEINISPEDIKKLNKLYKDLKAKCFIKGMPYFICAVVKNNEKETKYLADGVLTGSENIELNRDLIKFHLMIMGGCVAVSAREEVVLNLDEYLSEY